MKSYSSRHLCDACLEEEYKKYAHARVHELMDVNKKWMERFRIGDWAHWEYDFDSGTLRFSQDNKIKVVADMVVVGSTRGSEWEWAWGNPHLPITSHQRMEAVRKFGEEKQWPSLTTLFLKGDEYLGWELTSVAAHILGAQGAYRCPESTMPSDFMYVLVFDTKFVN